VDGDLKITHNLALGDVVGEALAAIIGKDNVGGEISIKENQPKEDTGAPEDTGTQDTGSSEK
jgi:hypothetical protein